MEGGDVETCVAQHCGNRNGNGWVVVDHEDS